MKSLKPVSEKMKVAWFWFTILLLIVIYPVVWFSGGPVFDRLISVYFHYDFYGSVLDLFILPPLPLGLSLLAGKRFFQDRHLLLFFAVLFLIFIVLGAFGLTFLFIPFSWIFVTHFLVVIFYFLLKNKMISYPFILHYGISSIVIIFLSLLIASLLFHIPLPNRTRDCVESTTSWSDKVLFLEPLTKTEIVKIVKSNEFAIRELMVAANKNSNGYVLDLTSNITATTAQEPIRTHLGPGSFPDTKSSIEAQTVLDAYDRNEAVVWGLAFPEMSREKFAGFVYEWDVKKHQVGIRYPVPEYLFFPNEINPPAEDSLSLERRCYPN